MAETAQLRVGDRVLELPIVEGSEGERAHRHPAAARRDRLHHARPGLREHGLVPLARSPSSTARRASCATAAIPIEELAEKSNFLEVAYLLIYGKLPTRERARRASSARSRIHTMLHEDFRRFFGFLPKDAHPMAACAAAVGALSTFYPDSLDPRNPRQVEISVHRLLAKMPTMAAYAYKHSIGQPFMYPRNELPYVANFLHMMFATPCETYHVDPVIDEGARPAADPARRPRAELLDLDGAPGRLARW